MIGLVCLIQGIIFVCGVYIIPLTRSGDRNNPTVIVYRLISVGISTVLCTMISYFYYKNLFEDWGLFNPLYEQLLSSLSTLLFCTCIFLGQLSLDIYLGHDLLPTSSLITLRNLLFGPLFEEIVFRGNMITLCIGYDYSIIQVYLLPSIIFGFSHIHHGIIGYIRGDLKLLESIMICIFQFTYTFLFGLFSTWYFLRTKSILNVIILHGICNYFGVPDFGAHGSLKSKVIFWMGTLIGLGIIGLS